MASVEPRFETEAWGNSEMAFWQTSHHPSTIIPDCTTQNDTAFQLTDFGVVGRELLKCFLEERLVLRTRHVKQITMAVGVWLLPVMINKLTGNVIYYISWTLGTNISRHLVSISLNHVQPWKRNSVHRLRMCFNGSPADYRLVCSWLCWRFVQLCIKRPG